MSLLRVNNLNVTFFSGEDRIRAVDRVSFELKAGERLGVVGESGSGKSALHMALLKLLPQPPACEVSGQVFLDDREVLSLSEKQLRVVRGGRMAMVFQNPLSALNPFLTIGEQLSEPLIYHRKLSARKAKLEAIGLLERVGIAEPAQRVRDYPHQFSGGMRQRVMIAMALAGQPEIIIADEPTTALDASVRRQILALFEDVCRETGAALILITHDLTAAAAICQRIHVMYAGRIVEAGTKEQVLQDPRHPYTAALLQASLQVEAAPGEMLTVIPGRPPDLRKMPGGCAFHPRCEFREARCETETPELRELTGKDAERGEGECRRQIACHVDLAEAHRSRI